MLILTESQKYFKMTHLLFRYVYRLVEYDPGQCFVARRHRSTTVVGHVVLGVREQTHDGQPLHFDLFAYASSSKRIHPQMDNIFFRLSHQNRKLNSD